MFSLEEPDCYPRDHIARLNSDLKQNLNLFFKKKLISGIPTIKEICF